LQKKQFRSFFQGEKFPKLALRDGYLKALRFSGLSTACLDTPTLDAGLNQHELSQANAKQGLGQSITKRAVECLLDFGAVGIS